MTVDDDRPRGRRRRRASTSAPSRRRCARSSSTEFVGQERVREQLGLVLDGARRRGRPPDHVLLSGPPGLGKTTLAMIIAAELATPLRVTSGPAIQHAGDLAAVLVQLTEGEVLFLDEIHRMSRPAEEMLYLAMEDFRVDVVVGKGPGATAIPLDLAPFTLVGATTRAGLLPGPLRDRFGFTGHMDFYDADELERVLHRVRPGCSTSALTATARPRSPARSRGTPRIANRLLRRVRDYAEVRADGVVTREVAAGRAGGVRGRRRSASTGSTGRCSTRWCAGSAAGRSGVTTLAVAVGEEPETVEEVAEPFLVRAGLLARTPARPGRHGGWLAAFGTYRPARRAGRHGRRWSGWLRRGARCDPFRRRRRRLTARGRPMAVGFSHRLGRHPQFHIFAVT